MKVLFDTSILIAAMIEPHPKHLLSLPWLQKVKKEMIEGIISSHSLIEIYSVLTAFPISPKISPAKGLKLINENIIKNFKIVACRENDYIVLLKGLAENQISGAASYDGLIAYSAKRVKVDKILTLNKKDFTKAMPEFADIIIEP